MDNLIVTKHLPSTLHKKLSHPLPFKILGKEESLLAKTGKYLLGGRLVPSILIFSNCVFVLVLDVDVVILTQFWSKCRHPDSLKTRFPRVRVHKTNSHGQEMDFLFSRKVITRKINPW